MKSQYSRLRLIFTKRIAQYIFLSPEFVTPTEEFLQNQSRFFTLIKGS